MGDESLSITLSDISYSAIPTSTTTIVAIGSFLINLDTLYKYIPITDYIVVPKKRGRKKKTEIINYNEGIPPGSIITITNEDQYRGVKIKTRKKKKKTKKDYFLNSVTIVMILNNNKLVNTKISKRGKFQITGCKMFEQAFETVTYIYKYIRNIEKYTGEHVIMFKRTEDANFIIEETKYFVIFNMVMKNKDFKLNFNINRENVDLYFNQNTDFISEYTPEVNPGINLKYKNNFPYEKNLPIIYFDEDTITRSNIDFDTLYTLLTPQEQKHLTKKMNEKYHTFMIFHSGSVIVSGSGPQLEEVYNKFIEIMMCNKEIFEESLRL